MVSGGSSPLCSSKTATSSASSMSFLRALAAFIAATIAKACFSDCLYALKFSSLGVAIATTGWSPPASVKRPIMTARRV
jgi:hypothetical protein